MQKSKKSLKSILSIFIAMIFAVSPLFLTGCIDFSKIYSGTPYGVNTEDNNSSGNSGGGSSGSSGNSGTNTTPNTQNNDEEEFDENSILAVPNQYIDTMLVTYRPNITLDNVENVFEKVSVYAISELYKQFGYSVESVNQNDFVKVYTAKTENNSTEYTSSNFETRGLVGDNIVAVEEQKFFDFADAFNFDFSDYINGSDWQEQLADALQPVDETDKSPEEINDEKAHKLQVIQQIHLNALDGYLNNLAIRRKFALGLIMIASNQNLTGFENVSNNISGSSDSAILTNSHNVFANYISDIETFDFSSTQQQNLVTFIANYVLGDEVINSSFVSSLSTNICNLLAKVTSYANFENDYTFVGGESEGMSGQQNYQSLVIMPKKDTQISAFDLYFSTEKQSGVKLHLYLRYYDATNGFVTFGDSNLYDLGEVNISYFSYYDDEDYEENNDGFDDNFDDDYDAGPTIYSELHDDNAINITEILKSASFDGKLPAFEQIESLEKNSPDVAVGEFGNGKYFDVLMIGDKTICVFSQDSFDTKQSYVELLFVTENVDDTFQVSINVEDEDFM